MDLILVEDPPLNMVPKLLESHLERYQLEDMYLTTIFGKIEDNLYRFINAGHPSPIDLSKLDLVESERIHPIGCGLLGDYDESIVNAHDLTKGSLLVYSDGLIDLKTKEGFLGEEGLLRILKPDASALQIYLSALSIAKSPLQEDDITMILLKKLSD